MTRIPGIAIYAGVVLVLSVLACRAEEGGVSALEGGGYAKKVMRYSRIGSSIVARPARARRRENDLSFTGNLLPNSTIVWYWRSSIRAIGYQVYSSSGAPLSEKLAANVTDYLQLDAVPGVSYGAYLLVRTPRGEYKTHVATVTVVSSSSASMRLESAPTGPDPSFRLGEIYVFPNPAKAGARPTFHVEVGISDNVKLKIYNVAGELAHDAVLTGLPQAIDDGNGTAYAYEYVWDGRIPSGVYYYTMEASKGVDKLRKAGKLAVIR